MNWESILNQSPLLAIVGGLAFYLYNEIKESNKKLQELTEASIKSIAENNIILNEFKTLIHDFLNKDK